MGERVESFSNTVKFCGVDVDREIDIEYRVQATYDEGKKISKSDDILLFTNGLRDYGAPEIVIQAGSPYSRGEFDIADFGLRANYLKKRMTKLPFLQDCYRQVTEQRHSVLMGYGSSLFDLSPLIVDLSETSPIRIKINKALQELGKTPFDLKQNLIVLGISFIYH